MASVFNVASFFSAMLHFAFSSSSCFCKMRSSVGSFSRGGALFHFFGIFSCRRCFLLRRFEREFERLNFLLELFLQRCFPSRLFESP